jgi:hypothetical protein
MGALLSALQNKLDAVHDLVLALTARMTYTSADETVINPTLTALNIEAENLRAAISAAAAPTLPGPSAADAAALQNAIKAAESAISANASVNVLANAAAVLIGTMKAPMTA